MKEDPESLRNQLERKIALGFSVGETTENAHISAFIDLFDDIVPEEMMLTSYERPRVRELLHLTFHSLIKAKQIETKK